MKVNEMMALADYGFLKSNRYVLQMNAPAGFKNKYDTTALTLINQNCNSVNLPGTDISTFDWASKSAAIKLPYQRSYNPIILNFYVDKDNLVRQFFEDWIDIIWNPETYDFSFLEEYSVDMSIVVLNDEGKKVATYAMNHVWPMKIDDIPLSYADGEIQKCTATMTYNTYKLKR